MTEDLLLEEFGPSVAPETHTQFRLAQLAILLDEVSPENERGLDLERLGYYEFFAANPFAVFALEDKLERAQLHYAAFDERQLTYASTGSRFANRRQRLQHDVALAVSYGVAEVRPTGFGITHIGHELAAGLLSLYAGQFRASVRLIHARFRKLSDAQLTRSARVWLREPSLVLDLFGSPELDEGGTSG